LSPETRHDHAEQHAEIRRLYYGEHWKVGTIAAALGVHHDTVRVAIAHDMQGVRRGMCRATQLDPYLPFIRDTLAQYPRLRATRLFEMVKGRGYTGSVVQLRRAVRLIRPAATATVYRRLTTLVGEEAQIDWGAFGSIRIGRGVRPRSGFVMVLSYSRAIFALFTVDQTLESFLRGHVEAFQTWPGVPRTLVYDNLRSAVLERAGTAIRFHPRLLELAGHYHFAPRPCTPGRGNEKGKVERQIQYLRHAFFAARTFVDVADLNAQFRRWRDEIAHQRSHPEQRDRTIAEVLAEEQPRLLPLPAHPFETAVMRTVVSGKTPYVRFDRNHYSIPHTHVRRPLTLLASPTTVRIVTGTEEIARHTRSYDTAQIIEQERMSPAWSPRHARTIRRVRATGSGWPCRRPSRCSSGSPHGANHSASPPRGCSHCSTTTARRHSAPPSTARSSATRSAPAPSRTSWKPDGGSGA
jgi:transposase